MVTTATIQISVTISWRYVLLRRGVSTTVSSESALPRSHVLEEGREQSTSGLNLDVPLFKHDARLSAGTNPSYHKVFVLSVPKSGTSLIGGFLNRLGIPYSRAHVDEHRYSDYRNRTIRDFLENCKAFTVVQSLE